MKRRVSEAAALAGALVMVMVLAATAAAGPHFSGWAPAQKIDEIGGNSPQLNTAFIDGCPIQSPDGRSLYLASNRPRFEGDTRTDLDIWVAHRADTNDPWGAPQNLGEPVNSAADDFCPTRVRGNGLFFVSREALPGTCGMGDIYFTRHDRRDGWQEPGHLGCAPTGPNTSLDEQGPSYVEIETGEFLYFSSGPDIYVSERRADGSFGPGQPVAELNTSSGEIQPNVRKDGREIVFASNDSSRPGALGGFDIYRATRQRVDNPWSAPINLGSAVNTAANETRPSFSWDALTLLFGRAPGPEGGSDIHVTTRTKLSGSRR